MGFLLLCEFLLMIVCLWLLLPLLFPFRRVQEVLDGLAITNDHFKFALQHCNPSALRETLVEVRHKAPVLLVTNLISFGGC